MEPFPAADEDGADCELERLPIAMLLLMGGICSDVDNPVAKMLLAMLLRKGDSWIVEKSVDTSLLVPGGALVDDRSQGPPKK